MGIILRANEYTPQKMLDLLAVTIDRGDDIILEVQNLRDMIPQIKGHVEQILGGNRQLELRVKALEEVKDARQYVISNCVKNIYDIGKRLAMLERGKKKKNKERSVQFMEGFDCGSKRMSHRMCQYTSEANIMDAIEWMKGWIKAWEVK